MKKYLIAPSILAANMARLGEEVDAVLKAGADLIHVDVMDNHYVPNLTFGPAVVKSLRKHFPETILDCHLMIKPVDQMIPEFAKAGASRLSIHPEATVHLDRSIELILDHGMKAGIVFNPATPLIYLEEVIHKIDFVLMMSVNPGFGGQRFIPQVLQKIKKAHEIIQKSGHTVSVEVDGGIDSETIVAAAKAGADTFVAGSAIYGQKEYAKVIAGFRKQLESIG